MKAARERASTCEQAFHRAVPDRARCRPDTEEQCLRRQALRIGVAPKAGSLGVGHQITCQPNEPVVDLGTKRVDLDLLGVSRTARVSRRTTTQ